MSRTHLQSNVNACYFERVYLQVCFKLIVVFISHISIVSVKLLLTQVQEIFDLFIKIMINRPSSVCVIQYETDRYTRIIF